MNKRILSCLMAFALFCTLAFSAGAVSAHRFAADVIIPFGDDDLTEYTSDADEVAEAWSEDETILVYGIGDVPENTLPDVEAEPEQGSVVKSVLICAVIGLVIALIVVLSVKSSYKPVHRKRDAAQYLVDGSLRVTASSETFLRSDVTERTIENKNDSGSNS